MKTTFQYFPAKVWITEPLGKVTLKQFINSHKNPTKEIKNILLKIQEASNNNDLKLKDSLKQNNLYYFCPSVFFDGKGRSYSNIQSFTGLMVVEYDKIDFAEELKKYVFDKFKCVVCAYTSPSGKGCKFIVKIPVVKTVDEYKEYFCGLAYYLDQVNGFDSANYNPSLPLFISMDENLLYREDAEEWLERGEKINSFKPTDIEELDLDNVGDKEITIKIKNIIKAGFNKIDDNGHPQVVKYSTTLGGFCGAGYVDQQEGLELLLTCIDENDYLSKNINGYKKTAKQMFERGLKNPLPFEDK